MITGKASKEILHHEDDGTEKEFWWVQDGPGDAGIIQAFDSYEEAAKFLNA